MRLLEPKCETVKLILYETHGLGFNRKSPSKGNQNPGRNGSCPWGKAFHIQSWYRSSRQTVRRGDISI